MRKIIATSILSAATLVGAFVVGLDAQAPMPAEEKPGAKEAPVKVYAAKVWNYDEQRHHHHKDNEESWGRSRADLSLKIDLDKELGTPLTFALDSDFKVMAGKESLLEEQWGEKDKAGRVWQEAGSHHEGSKAGELQINLNLKAPPRGATELAATGSIWVKLGKGMEDKKVTKAQDIKAEGDLFVDKDAGVRIQLVEKSDTELKIKVWGSHAKVMNLQLIDGKGEQIWGGSSKSVGVGHLELGFFVEKGELKDFGLSFKLAKSVETKHLPIVTEEFKLP